MPDTKERVQCIHFWLCFLCGTLSSTNFGDFLYLPLERTIMQRIFAHSNVKESGFQPFLCNVHICNGSKHNFSINMFRQMVVQATWNNNKDSTTSLYQIKNVVRRVVETLIGMFCSLRESTRGGQFSGVGGEKRSPATCLHGVFYRSVCKLCKVLASMQQKMVLTLWPVAALNNTKSRPV